ncbi:MAG: serine/threonine protein kinase [Elusimicrobiales bacterium]|nr:serine/threonine protein kinase [Elusimicrobiales bacterium]
MAKEKEENLTGKEFAGCKVISKIGQGGMGSVYRAHHKALNKIVCVKILDQELARDKRNLEFFLREARSAAKLDHPNIVHVYNFGKENHNYFIVMSFIDGRSLQDIVVKDGPIPAERATKFMIELLDGLTHAHSKGIIHRDIKPSNILVDSNDKSYLVDFGLARSVSEEKELTQAGEMIGTAYFMSPEQCLAQKVDNRADIYAVGATYFYLLTGKYPFDGKTSVEVMHKHIGSKLPSPLLINPNIPRWAATFIEHAMKKKPEERYKDAEEAKKTLQDFSTGKKLIPNPGGEIILDLSSKIHDPISERSFEVPQPATPVPDSNSIEIQGMPNEFELGSDGGASSFTNNESANNSYFKEEGVTVDWNSGETINAAVPKKPDFPSEDPSMNADRMQDIDIGLTEETKSSNDISEMMTNSYDAIVEQQEAEAKEEQKKVAENAEKEAQQPKPQKSKTVSFIYKILKTAAYLALIIIAGFLFLIAGACGMGATSFGNAFQTNPTGASVFSIIGIALTVVAILLKPAGTSPLHYLYAIAAMLSAFAGGAFIEAPENTEIAKKMITAVSMLAQNSSGMLTIIYSLASFLLAIEISFLKHKLFKFISAALFLLSIWFVSVYVRIWHEYFGFNAWGIAAAISALIALFYTITDSKDKVLGPKMFVIAADIALMLMICVPNINRAAENDFQKLNKEWDVFMAAQKEEGFKYPKELEPKPQRPLEEFKAEAKQEYFAKEKDKFNYAIKDAGGLIVLYVFLSLLATLCVGGKIFQPSENQ